jgi:hypothetical protein
VRFDKVDSKFLFKHDQLRQSLRVQNQEMGLVVKIFTMVLLLDALIQTSESGGPLFRSVRDVCQIC